MTEEIWKDVPEFEGYYQVSNMGRVRSVPHQDKYGRKHGGKLLRPINAGNGYYRVHLSKNDKRSLVFVHRLVAFLFVPNPQKHTIINHKDENPFNNRADNLEWCTQSYNINYGLRNRKSGEKHRGERCFFHKLKANDVTEIKRATAHCRTKECYQSLAEKYQVSAHHIKNIASGRSWSWLTI